MNTDLWLNPASFQQLRQNSMRNASKILFGTAAALLVVLGCASKQKVVNMPHGNEDPRWSAIDSLSNIGQFASA
ncbi:MAG: hypothetical protein ABIQ75_10125, partial [Flavobacteriales bacterium]